MILVVDDEVDVRYLASWHLSDAGYDIREAGRGDEALTMLDGVDLVMLDYRMPGMSGIETLEAIVARDGPPVVIMTAQGSEELAVEAMRAGAVDYVVKDGDYLNRLPHVVERAARLHALDKQARASERLAEGLLEAAPDAIVVVDAAGLIQIVNKQTRELFGWEQDELIGEPVEVLLPRRFRDRHPDLRAAYCHEPLVRPMGPDADLVACRKDGTEFPVAISLSPLQTERGLLVSAAIRDITDRKRAEAALAHQATHDILTGLPNRLLLQDRLSHALDRTRRLGTTVAVLFLDVDRLKLINDSRGHTYGDELLQAIAARLLEATRPHDTLARFGGDEFVIVTEGMGPTFAPHQLAERITSMLKKPIAVGGTEMSLSVSIGIAVAGPGDDAESLLRDADAAMYRAKDEGRDRWVLFDAAMRDAATGRLEAEHMLRRAVDRSEFLVYYQPIVELTDRRLVGFEALARWRRPGTGLELPANFIPLSEETGLVTALGATVLRESCRQLAAWHRDDPRLADLSVSVNLSALQLLTPELPRLVSELLDTYDLAPPSLCLEITESVLLADADSSARALHALKALGVRVAVDDFGTGYSSLTYLKRFPLDSLKIDKSFVDGLGSRARGQHDRAIVAGIIDVAHAFGLTTVAEGAETQEQVAQLELLGCEQAQGYFWSAPLASDAMGAWIETARTAKDTIRGPDMPRSARVLIVDDERSARRLERLMLDEDAGFNVVAEAEDGRQAVALARHHQPDLVLLDLAMPGVGGLEALPLIRAVAPRARVVVLSALDGRDLAAKAYEVGAAGYLEKGGDPDTVVASINQMLARAG